jgi:bifunctional DNase/RNase
VSTAADHRVTIRALVVDPAQNAPVVVLETDDQQTLLPIWIGMSEASAIALALDGVTPPRPMTHDLLVRAIQASAAHIDRVRIRSIDQGVFHGELHLRGPNEAIHVLDCRPSDAIAIATRVDCDILVAGDVMAAAGVAPLSREQALEQVLDTLRPEDLGSYEM